jgi:hypothetical protein
MGFMVNVTAQFNMFNIRALKEYLTLCNRSNKCTYIKYIKVQTYVYKYVNIFIYAHLLVVLRNFKCLEEIFLAIPCNYPGIHLGRLRDILRPKRA